MTLENDKNSTSNAKLLGIVVLIVTLVVLGIWLYSIIKWIIYGFLALLIIIPLFLNRKTVSAIITYISGLYKKHTALGVLGTLGAIIAFLPFSAFLVLKTIWENLSSRNSKKKTKATSLDDVMPSDNILLNTEEQLQLPEEPLPQDIDTKFPPTEQ
jgi:cellulose synthase/poly-beta-1,6-N-acetylglucosamine synthase-like glycosyltransferase